MDVASIPYPSPQVEKGDALHKASLFKEQN